MAKYINARKSAQLYKGPLNGGLVTYGEAKQVFTAHNLGVRYGRKYRQYIQENGIIGVGVISFSWGIAEELMLNEAMTTVFSQTFQSIVVHGE